MIAPTAMMAMMMAIMAPAPSPEDAADLGYTWVIVADESLLVVTLVVVMPLAVETDVVTVTVLVMPPVELK
jgi:hypothetical protein